MIIRCEVSLDCGKTWRLATIAREEEPTVYGELQALQIFVVHAAVLPPALPAVLLWLKCGECHRSLAVVVLEIVRASPGCGARHGLAWLLAHMPG